MLQREIEGVITAEAAAGYANSALAVDTFDQGKHLVQQIAFISKVPHDAVVRMDRTVIPAFRIDAINAEDLQMTRFNFVPNGMNHPGILIFIKLALGGWKDQDRHACVTVGQQLHMASEPVTVPIVIIAAHLSDSAIRNKRSLSS